MHTEQCNNCGAELCVECGTEQAHTDGLKELVRLVISEFCEELIERKVNLITNKEEVNDELEQ